MNANQENGNASHEILAWRLLSALESRDWEAVKQTLVAGANPNTNFAGETALHIATELGQEAVVTSLLQHGADPSPKTRYYELTPLHTAADRGDVRIVRSLLEAGADNEARTNGGWTPFHCAVAAGHFRVARLLLEHGANADAVNKAGETVLHFVEGTSLNLYSWLSDRVSEIDLPDADGATPLTYAAAYGRKDIAAVLLGKGASPQHLDVDGNTPEDVARSRGHEDTANFLKTVHAFMHDEIAIELHNELYHGASDLLLPYLEFGERRPVVSEKDRAALERGCEMLNRVFSINPLNWNAMWVSGHAYRANGLSESALNSFREAYAIERLSPDVGRELAAECIRLGRADEAVQICAEVLELRPLDADLIANYGLALLISKRIDEAEEAVAASLSLSPDDPITLRLANLMTAVRQGRQPPPDRWPP
jgi:ankyrin repeat protein